MTLAAAAALLGLTGCGEPIDRPEVVTKLRTLGVRTVPAVYDVSAPEDIEIKVFLASTVTDPVSVESYSDPAYNYADAVEADMDADTQTVTPYALLSIIEVSGRIAAADLEAALADGGAGNFRYGFTVRQGSDEENIVGNIVGGESADAGFDSASIVAPEAGAVAGEAELSGEVAGGDPTAMRVSWLASGGEVANRRALRTKWKEVPSTPQTVILTARGNASGAFAIDVQDYNTEE